MLRAAEKRGIRVINSSSSPINHTLSQFKSPVESMNQRQSNNALVSDVVNKGIEIENRYSSNNIPEFMNKYKYVQQSHDTSKSFHSNGGVYIKTNDESFGLGQYHRHEPTSVHK